jgi:hypothetical protein
MLPLKSVVFAFPETHFKNQPQTIKNAVQKLTENKISIRIEHKGSLQPLEAYQIVSSISLCHGLRVLNNSISNPFKSSGGLRQDR